MERDIIIQKKQKTKFFHCNFLYLEEFVTLGEMSFCFPKQNKTLCQKFAGFQINLKTITLKKKKKNTLESSESAPLAKTL